MARRADRGRGMGVARLFWIVAGGDMVVLPALAADTVVSPHGQFAGLVLVMFPCDISPRQRP